MFEHMDLFLSHLNLPLATDLDDFLISLINNNLLLSLQTPRVLVVHFSDKCNESRNAHHARCDATQAPSHLSACSRFVKPI